MGSPDHARDAINLAAATVDALVRVVKHAIFGVELINRRAPSLRVVLTEHFLEIAGQQGRYVVGHSFVPPGIECGLRYLDLPHAVITIPLSCSYSSRRL